MEFSGRREEAIGEAQEPSCWQEGQRAGSPQTLSTVSLTTPPCRPRKNPLFTVDLVLDSSGVHYSTPLEQFETSLLNLFDKGILATHAVPQLEKVQL